MSAGRHSLWTCDGDPLYLGHADSGLEYRRHNHHGARGFWLVIVTGWCMNVGHAVMDDFGSLVRVEVQ